MRTRTLTDNQLTKRIEDHQDTLDGLRKPDGTYPAEDTIYATEQRAKLDTLKMEKARRRKELEKLSKASDQVSPR